ncbi:Trehalose-phosphatase [Podosphaera aphanis]|nr:Trehalose-phosphatase [Podosphaera aphanis]
MLDPESSSSAPFINPEPNLESHDSKLPDSVASNLADNSPCNSQAAGPTGVGDLKNDESLKVQDPCADNAKLGLSGSVITATFCIPFSLKYKKRADWVLDPRRGTSALFDSFAHLSSTKTPWNHTLVGWTGEITVPDVSTPPQTPPLTGSFPRYSHLHTSSAPISVDGSVTPTAPTHTEGLWLSKRDQSNLEKQLSRNKTYRMVPVWLHDDIEDSADDICLKDQARWRRFAEHDLYTLFHYKQNEPTDGREESKSWADYVRMNQNFANRILELYKPGDIVMIHDYHLLLLPSMLRQRIPHIYISFFLHIPFPSSEFIRCLPRRKEVLKGVLGANLIGFQSPSYARHFASCCTRILGLPSDIAGVNFNGAKVNIGSFPIGIDAAAVEKNAFDNPLIDSKVKALRRLYDGKKIIVGRDRLDSVRGVAQKLMAFQKFHADYPEWQGKVVLIQVTSPTSIEKEKEPTDNKTERCVSELVATINGIYGSLSFSPVQHYPQYLSQQEYLALLRSADIGLITSVRDGMNTTSLEYVICQRDNHGPLILSEFSGTACSLKDAIHINPWDFTDVGKQINSALTLSSEKKAAMHKSLYDHVTTRNVQEWTNGFIHHLLTVVNEKTTIVSTPLLDKELLVKHYHAASKRLFMLDYDGTLTPIVPHPAAALPCDKLIQTLKILAADPNNSVWIISGRDQDFLQQHLGDIEGLGFSAEHGSFIRFPGHKSWENMAETLDLSWQKEVIQVFQDYTVKTPGSFIERKRCALTWHYRPSDPTLGARNARECQKELERTVGSQWEVEVMTGKANLEVRPTFINKGEIAKRLILESKPKPQFVLCLGDDSTDEDMFRALNAAKLANSHCYSILVGASSKMTLASWYLPEPVDVVSTIALLLEKKTNSNVANFGAEANAKDDTPEIPSVKL